MTDDLVARLPTDAAARRLPEFIKTLRINRAARRESVYASDNVYALLDALDTAETRVRELEAEVQDAKDHIAHADAYQSCAMNNLARAELAERALAEAYERAAEVADCHADECDAASFASTVAEQVSALRSKEQAAHEIATAIRKLAQEVKHEAE